VSKAVISSDVAVFAFLYYFAKVALWKAIPVTKAPFSEGMTVLIIERGI
jgi:hypothetical protein